LVDEIQRDEDPTNYLFKMLRNVYKQRLFPCIVLKSPMQKKKSLSEVSTAAKGLNSYVQAM